MNKLICFLILASASFAHAAQPTLTRAQVLAQLVQIESVSKVCFENNLDQMGMTSCAGDKADAADALLNQVYKQKMQSLDLHQQQLLRLQERQFVKSKVQAENEIESDGGSIAPMESSLNDYDLTKKQIMVLLN